MKRLYLVMLSALSALCLAGCGERDDCAAGCEKIQACCEAFGSCKDGATDAEARCVAACSADTGNQPVASCLVGASSCSSAQMCFGIDNTSTCRRATDKLDACVEASTIPSFSIGYNGWCSDQADFVIAATGERKAVPFKSWSEEYLACDIDPQTCECPGQTPLEEL